MQGTWKRGHHRRGRAVGTPGVAPTITQTAPHPSVSAGPEGGGAPSDPPPFWEVTNDTVDGGGGVSSLIGRLPSDPDPSWLEQAGEQLPRATVAVTKQVQEDIKGMLAVASLIPADILAVADPYCAGAYAQALPQIIDAAVPIICRSQRALNFLLGKQGFVEWTRLAAAFKPVIVAVWAHHIAKTVELVEGAGDDWSQYQAAVA